MSTVDTKNKIENSTVPTLEASLMPAEKFLSPVSYQSINTALSSIFSETAETKIQKTRQILGETATNLTDTEIEVFVTELQCLVDSWFDVYEEQAFNGLTLQHILTGQ